MLTEEVEMEVKSSSRILPNGSNAKGCQLDKTKDNYRSGNGSPRYNKRRDPPQQKSEFASAARRPQPQKFKSLDKRPRGRNSSWSGRRDEVTSGQRAEYGSALPYGPKKVNLNHLINFTFAPRDHYGDGHAGGSGRSKWNRRRPRYNKEQFLQANCQFVVRADHDYTVHAADADILVDWDLIEQVRIFSHEETCCPICLYPPTAAKLTRCGHVYCWTCILHYLSLEDRSWRKCPICYEAIVEKDLKSVIAVETHNITVGEKVTMRLMKREKGSVVAVPMSHQLHQQNDPFKFGDDITKECFVKLLTTTNLQILKEIIKPEKEILLSQLAACDDDFERTFIESAIKLHQTRADNLLGKTDDVENADYVNVEGAKHDMSTGFKECFTYSSAYSDEKEVENSKSSSFSSPRSASPITQELKEAKCEKEQPLDPLKNTATGVKEESLKADTDNRKRRQSSDSEHTYYFYQASDSQHMYIHSLNARCLISEYGSLAKCPETITGEVIEIEHLTMTEELRKRYRYLKHLPLTCEFCVCELKLKSPVVSKETLKAFSDDFHRKKRARDKKVREEKKRSQKIELEEEKKQGKYPSPRMSMQSHRHFPEFSSTCTENNLQAPCHSPTSSIVSTSTCHDETAVFDAVIASNASDRASPVSIESGSDAGPTSFAQMLKTSSAKPQEAWPNLSSPKNTKIGTIPSAAVWHKSSTPAGLDGSDEDDNEDYVPVPTYKDSFSNAIQVALDKAAMKEQSSNIEEAARSPDSPGGKKGKKGKKKQKQLLFSTAGQRFK